MQQSKAAVSLEVKRVIGTLCRLLAALGLECVPAPEAFRRAKFGGGAEEDQFWQLLAGILQMAGIVSMDTVSQLRGERRKLVAAGLWQSGCYAGWMYDDGGSVCSRQLLLALGWLLARGVLENLLTQRLRALDHMLLTPLPEECVFSGELDGDGDSLRRLQWLIGRLRHQRRSLLSVVRPRTRALHRVFAASLVSSAAPPSGHSPAVLQQDCARLRQLCDLLETFLSWKQVESIFWTWMDSVMDTQGADPQVNTSSAPPSGRAAPCHHGDRRIPTAQEARRTSSGELSASSILQTCRALLEDGDPARKASRGPQVGLPAAQAADVLLGAESVLLQARERRRLASRTQLQEKMSRLEELLFVPL